MTEKEVIRMMEYCVNPDQTVIQGWFDPIFAVCVGLLCQNIEGVHGIIIEM